MSKEKKLRLSKAWLGLAVCLCFGQARADIVNFNVTGSGITASGTLTLTATGTPGIDEITNITGLFSTTHNGGFSGAITGLNPGSYNASNPTSDTLSIWDNLFYATPPAASCSGGGPSPYALLDYCGLDFKVAGGYEVNVFGNPSGTSAAGYLLSDGLSGGHSYIDNNAPVSFAVTTVPESASFPVLAAGLFLTGLVMRKKFQQAPAER